MNHMVMNQRERGREGEREREMGPFMWSLKKDAQKPFCLTVGIANRSDLTELQNEWKGKVLKEMVFGVQ